MAVYIALVEPVQIFLIFPKMVELSLFLLIAFQENYKYKDVAWSNRSLIHRFFMAGAIGWIVFLTLDIVVFLLASISFTNATPIGVYMGYNLKYPSLFYANILRDISTSGFTALLFSNFYISLHIELGEERIKKYLKFPFMFMVVLVSAILVAFEQISVTKTANNIIVDAVWTGLGAISMVAGIILYLVVLIRLGNFIVKNKANISKEYHKQIVTLYKGLLLIWIGLLFFFIAGVLNNIFPDFFSQERIRFVVQFTGHFIWTLSPVYIYHGIKVPLEIINPTLKDYKQIGVKELYSKAQDSLMAYFIILDNEFIYSSRLIANIFEISYEELMSWDMKAYINKIVPDDRKKFTSYLEKFKTTDVNEESESGMKELFYRIQVDKQIRWVRQITSVYRSYGKLVIQAAITDYTHQHMLSTKLFESQTEFQSIIDNMSDIMLKLNPSGVIISVNPAFIKETGYNHYEVVGQSLQLYVENTNNILDKMLQHVLENNKLQFSEILNFIEKDGSIKKFECHPIVIYSENGDPLIQLFAKKIESPE